MDQHPLAWCDLRGTVQHLVRGDIVQNEADSLCVVQPAWHWDQFMLGQADKLCIRTKNRQRGNDLAWFDSGDNVTEPIYHANQIPSRREGQAGSLGMNAFAHHEVRQGNTRSLHPDSHFTTLRLGTLFFNHPKFLGPTVVADDDALMLHGPAP